MPRPLPTRLSTPAIAVLAAATLTLTACGGEQGRGSEAEEGPLSEYLSALWDGEEYTQEMLDAEQKKTEDLVAECMNEQGFEYVPNLQGGGVILSSEGDDIDWGSEEFAKQYGYGLVNSPGMEDMPSDDEEIVDPNSDYYDSLSESERTAYDEALWGPSPTEEEMAAMEEGDGSSEYDWTKAGCYGAAQHEVSTESNGVQAAYEDPEFAELFAEMQNVWSGIYDGEGSNDEVAALDRDWADCMAEAGYDGFASPMSAQQQLSDEYMELQMPDGEDGEWQEPSDADKQEFQKREIATALADRSCQDEIGYEEKLQKIQFALEQEFVDEHRAELDALIAKHGVEQKK